MYTLVMLIAFIAGGPVSQEKPVSTHPSLEACHEAVVSAVQERAMFYPQAQGQVFFICRPGMPAQQQR